MYEKNLWEKLGEHLAINWKRFFIGIASCLILGPFGLFIAFAIFTKTKTSIVENITMTTSAGKNYKCVLIKQAHYAYLFPFISPFYFLPYKTDYFLAKGVYTTLKPKQEIHNFAPFNNVAKTEKITKAKFKAIMENPNNFADETEKECVQAREEFLQDTKDAFDIGILKEIFATNMFSWCQAGPINLIFLYSKKNDKQTCYLPDSDTLKKVAEHKNPFAFLPLAYNYVCIEPLEHFGIFDNQFKESILKKMIETGERHETEEEKEFFNTLNTTKPQITKEIITEELTKNRVAPYKKLKNLYTFFLSYNALLTFTTTYLLLCGEIGMLVLDIPLYFLVYFLVKKIINFHKTAAKFKIQIENGDYKILHTQCTSKENVSYSIGLGMNMPFLYHFKCGKPFRAIEEVRIENNECYTVTIDGDDVAGCVFNCLHYQISPDLNFESLQ